MSQCNPSFSMNHVINKSIPTFFSTLICPKTYHDLPQTKHCFVKLCWWQYHTHPFSHAWICLYQCPTRWCIEVFPSYYDLSKLLSFEKTKLCNKRNNSSLNPFVHWCVPQVFNNINISINLLILQPSYK